MSTESCPTVRIKFDNEDGCCVINASAFDPKKHTLFDPEKPDMVQTAEPQEAPSRRVRQSKPLEGA